MSFEPIPTTIHGTVDVSRTVPNGFVHISGKRIGPTVKKLGIPCARTVVGFKRVRGRYVLVEYSVVIHADNAAALNDALSSQLNKPSISRAKRFREKFSEAVERSFPLFGEAEELVDKAARSPIGLPVPGTTDFGSRVRALLAAIARHNYANYDDLLARGVPRDATSTTRA